MVKKRRTKEFFVGVIVILVMFTPGVSHGFSLLGPSRTEVGGGDHSAANPDSGYFQEFNAGFRWSISDMTFAFDSSFTTAFGSAGKGAVSNAFSTWDTAFGTTGPVSTGFMFDPGYSVLDIESIALHEIGHALGFFHPDQADDFGLNFDASGSARSATGEEVMNSTIANKEVQRALTKDETDGFNYLYSPSIAIPMPKGPPLGIEYTYGPGDLDFTRSGTAALGGTVGANIDIFADDLGASGILGVTYIYGGFRTGGGLLPYKGTSFGGYFDGVPADLHFLGLDNANHGSTLSSIDIVFNNNPLSRLGVNPIPEPATLMLFGIGILSIAYRRRRKKTA